MELKHGFISADDHVQEHPEVWTSRMSKAKWGDRIPHLERQADGTERWVVNGQKIDLPGVALAGAAMPDRAREPHPPTRGRHDRRLRHGVELRPLQRVELHRGETHAGNDRAGQARDTLHAFRRPGAD